MPVYICGVAKDSPACVYTCEPDVSSPKYKSNIR